MRSTFSSSRLVRLLDEHTPVDADASAMDVAERLGLWLNAFDAIGLQAAHQTIRAIADAQQPVRRAARPPALADDVQRVRGALASAIARGLDAHGAQGYAAYQQRHQELQRQMEQMVATLREHVRQALAAASPRLRQLAVLDAAFEQALAAREQRLLPVAASLLERRFAQMQAAADPDTSANDTLAAFAPEWRQALLAELDLRLEPVHGLVEALRNELKNPS